MATTAAVLVDALLTWDVDAAGGLPGGGASGKTLAYEGPRTPVKRRRDDAGHVPYPMRASGKGRARMARLGAFAALLLLSACQPAVLDPQGPVSRAQRTLLFDSLAIMLAIVGPTVLATIAFAWWFRASNPRALRLPDWAYSGRIELVTWSVPLLTIMLLGGITWIGAHDLDPAKPLASEKPTLEVQVVSLDWKWLFILPEQKIASVNRLVIPAGRPVHFTLTSAGVWNSFFVPQLGSMIYTMHGMATQLNLQADRPGLYAGLSTHLSGDGFSDMRFEVEAASDARFAAWVEEAAQGAGPVLDAGSYAELARQDTKVGRLTYRRADPGLFQRIVGQELPAGPGPSANGTAGQASSAAPAAAGAVAMLADPATCPPEER